MTIKNTLSIFGILIFLSCGQADNTSSTSKAESNPEKAVSSTNIVASSETPKSIDMEKAEKELMEESLDITEAETPSKETLNGNIENPKPVKVREKVEKVKEVVTNSKINEAPSKVKEVVKEVKEIIEEKPTIETQDVEIEEEVAVEFIDQEIEEEAPIVEKKPVIPAFSHESFNNLLKKHVSSTGKVNYNNLKSEEAKLDAYLKDLDKNPPAADWSKSKKMAYWINAYNAGTIKLILKNYPLKSITSLHGGKPWDQKWIPLGSKTYSLDNIENDILRPVYKDARIHFAVNCAAKSCPPLLNQAWTEGNLKRNFEKQAKAFINNTTHNKITPDAIEISKIFEWYAVDFGDIITYLNKYSTVKINPGAKITYKEYNWDLNK